MCAEYRLQAAHAEMTPDQLEAADPPEKLGPEHLLMFLMFKLIDALCYAFDRPRLTFL